MRIQIILTILTLLTSCSIGLKVSDFQPSLFKFTSIEQGFRNIDTGTNRQGQVITFSDLDGDRFTDYIAIQSRNTSSLIFYLWNQQKQQFYSYERKLDTVTNIKIQEIIVYDFNQDGNNQLLITTKQNSMYKSTLYKIGCIDCLQTLSKIQNSEINNQNAVPFLLQHTKNVKIFTFINNERFLYEYNFINNSYKIMNFSEIVDESNYILPFKKVQKHFASTIDLNNDCQADLSIISYSQNQNGYDYFLQVYERKKNNRFQMKKLYSLDNELANRIVSSNSNDVISTSQSNEQIQNILIMTYTDIDHNGAVDMIFLYKSNDKLNLKAHLNPSTPQQICEPLLSGIFPATDFQFTEQPSLKLPQSHSLTQKSVPIFNDVNADGLPDILMILKDKNGYDKVNLLINEGNLIFRKYDDQWKAYDLNNPAQVMFYDYADDGKMDLLIISQQKKQFNQNTVYSYTRTSVINNLQSDTLHLKILPLSITSLFEQDKKKSSSSFGVTIQWLFTDIDGQKLVQTINQKYQWNYNLYQLPYAYTGLGRTNNYVEQLTVGYQINAQRQDWTPIIPNSQLMVYKQSSKWKLQTLLRNNQRVNDVIYVAIFILIIMGAIIFYLNYKETQQDKRDHYSFIQLIR